MGTVRGGLSAEDLLLLIDNTLNPVTKAFPWLEFFDRFICPKNPVGSGGICAAELNKSSLGRDGGSYFRLPPASPLCHHYPVVLSRCSLLLPPCSLLPGPAPFPVPDRQSPILSWGVYKVYISTWMFRHCLHAITKTLPSPQKLR